MCMVMFARNLGIRPIADGDHYSSILIFYSSESATHDGKIIAKRNYEVQCISLTLYFFTEFISRIMNPLSFLYKFTEGNGDYNYSVETFLGCAANHTDCKIVDEMSNFIVPKTSCIT